MVPGLGISSTFYIFQKLMCIFVAETMTAEDMTGLAIPSVFVGDEDGYILRDYARQDVNGTSYYVVITSDIPFNISTHLLVPFAMVVGLCFFIMMLFMVKTFP